MNYIVKNCPCVYGFVEAPMYCLWKDEALTFNTLCQNCTDCIIKQVIEKCKNTCRKRCTNDCLGTKKHCGYGEILQLFDIEEVRE